MQQTQTNKMGTKPIFPLLITMSLPAILSMTVQAMYNIVDSYFVAKISENALTAVSLAFPIQNLIIAFACGIGVGVNSLLARKLGEGKDREAGDVAVHGLILSVLVAIVFALLGWLFSGAFFRAFTDIPDILEMGESYLSIVCIFSFGVFIEIIFEKTLQATGNMIWPMIFQLIGAITNIILDPIFIFGYCGMPKMGVTGAAVATVAGQILSAVVAAVVMFTQKHAVKLHFRGFRMHGEMVRDICAVGVPSTIMMSISSIMTTLMNSILISFTETAVAVFGVYFKLQSLIFMPVFGVTNGCMPIMGYNYGARKRKRLMATLWYGILVCGAIMAVGTAIFLVIPDQMLLLFNASAEMVKIGVPALRIICLCFIPAALGIMFSTLFQAVGNGLYSLIVSVLRQLVALVPLAYLLSKIGGLMLLWYSFPLAEIVSLIASLLLMRHLYKKNIRGLDIEEQAEETVELTAEFIESQS